METNRIFNLYQYLLKFSYGDKKRLVTDLTGAINKYETAPGKDHPKAIQRVNDYRAVIELAQQ